MSLFLIFGIIFTNKLRLSILLPILVFSILSGIECRTTESGSVSAEPGKDGSNGSSFFLFVPSVGTGSLALPDPSSSDEASSGISLDSITSLFEQEFPDSLGKRISESFVESNTGNSDVAVAEDSASTTGDIEIAAQEPVVQILPASPPTPLNIPVSTITLPLAEPVSVPVPTSSQPVQSSVQYVILPKERERRRRHFRPSRLRQLFGRSQKTAQRRASMVVPKASLSNLYKSVPTQNVPTSINVVQIREMNPSSQPAFSSRAREVEDTANRLTSSFISSRNAVHLQAASEANTTPSERSDDEYSHNYISGNPHGYTLAYPDEGSDAHEIGEEYSSPIHHAPAHVVDHGSTHYVDHGPVHVGDHGPTHSHVINHGTGWSSSHLSEPFQPLHSTLRYLKDSVTHFPWTPYFGIKAPVPVFTVLGKTLDSSIGGAWAARKALKRGVGSVLSSKLRLGGTLFYVGSEVAAKVVDAASSI